MGITPNDLQAQRELLERGERILEAQKQQAERARLRDTFAAAALTGLLAKHGLHGSDFVQERAYVVADAMLRERANQPKGPDSCKPSGAPDAWATAYAVTRACEIESRGDTEPRNCAPDKPAAWATFYPNGSTASVYIGRKPPHAEPLYRHSQPTLTDAEREAVEAGIEKLDHFWFVNEAATLRGLLERLQ